MNKYNNRSQIVQLFERGRIKSSIKNLKIRTKLLSVYLVLFVVVLLILGSTQYFFLRKPINSSIEAELNNTTRLIQDMVESSINMAIRSYLRAVAEKNMDIVRSLYERTRRGEISENDARRMLVRIFSSQTIGKTGYIYCLTSRGRVIVHPKKDMLGSDVTRFEFVRKQIQQKEGFMSYDWKNPGEQNERPKALYMTYFEPWDLIISASSYRDEFRELVRVDDFKDKVLSIRFGETGYSYIVDMKGNIIIHPIISGNVIDVNDDNNKGFIREMLNNKSGKIVYKWKNPGETKARDKLVIYNYIREMDWLVASSSYVDEFYKPLNFLNRIFLTGFIITLVLVVIVNMALSTYITAPLIEIIEKFKMAGRGNLTVSMPETGEDELGDLARYFNLFIKGLVELKKKEEQLVRIQKMETMWYVAGGLAHDFNNMLGGIMGSVSFLQYYFSEEEERGSFQEENEIVISTLNTIENAAHRAADMVGRLLTLSRKREMIRMPVDLNKSVKNIINICQNTFDKKVGIHVEYTCERAMVMADPTQLEQVILNLCINSEHAMTIMRKSPEEWGGHLTLKIGRFFADSVFCEAHPEAVQQNYLTLEVSDTGVGMSRETMGRIFDPFFSTKKEKGTGLGLSMVCSIINQIKGFVTVYSHPGVGSVFRVYLPEVSALEHAVYDDKKKKCSLVGKGLVLLVDDEAIILKTSKTILNDHGYEALVAYNGEEAISIFREKHASIKAVVLDMAMPDMTGREVFYQLRKIDPSGSVILSSGLGESEYVKSVMDLGFAGFLQKPYSMMELLGLVYKVVNREEDIPQEEPVV